MKSIGPALTTIHEICTTSNSDLSIFNLKGKMMFNRKKSKICEEERIKNKISANDWHTLLKQPVGLTNLFINNKKENKKVSLLQIFFFIRYNNGEPFCFCSIENYFPELKAAKNVLHDFQKKMEIPCRMKIISKKN